MTGLEALQALRDGKKLTIPEFQKPYEDSNERYYVALVERMFMGQTYKHIMWVSTLGYSVDSNPSTGEYGNLVDAALFLRDDWEISNGI